MGLELSPFPRTIHAVRRTKLRNRRTPRTPEPTSAAPLRFARRLLRWMESAPRHASTPAARSALPPYTGMTVNPRNWTPLPSSFQSQSARARKPPVKAGKPGSYVVIGEGIESNILMSRATTSGRSSNREESRADQPDRLFAVLFLVVPSFCSSELSNSSFCNASCCNAR